MECLVVFDYNAAQKDELTIKKGDIIRDVISFEDGWKKGWLNGKEGVFPDNFVRVLKINNDTNENHSLTENDINSKLRDRPTINHMKVQQNSATDVKMQKVLSSSLSPSLGKKNFIVSILPNMEKKKWTSSSIIGEQFISGKSELFKSKISKSTQNINTDKTYSFDLKNVILESKYVVVMFDYKAENPDELQLEEGDVVKVLDKNLVDEGWWKGIKKSGEIGIFPSNFVQPYHENHSSISLKKPINDNGVVQKSSENGSICDHSNISGSASFNDVSIGSKAALLTSPIKGSKGGKTSLFSFKTKNVQANSCSADSLSELTKSKKSEDLSHNTQNTISKFRIFNKYETSKGDDVSNSLEKNFDDIKKVGSLAASPCNNDGDYYVLKSEFDRFKLEVDQKMSKLSIRIQTLIEEIDEEKKQRAASEIELVRLRRLVHMLDAQSSNGLL